MIAWAICVPAERAADCTAERKAISAGDMRWRLPATAFPPKSPPTKPDSASIHPPEGGAVEAASLPSAWPCRTSKAETRSIARVVFALHRALRS